MGISGITDNKVLCLIDFSQTCQTEVFRKIRFSHSFCILNPKCAPQKLRGSVHAKANSKESKLKRLMKQRPIDQIRRKRNQKICLGARFEITLNLRENPIECPRVKELALMSIDARMSLID